MRDQYAGDVSDVLKFALLRALAGTDRKLGVAWYYAAGDDGRSDGRHLEWRQEPAWRLLDKKLHFNLSALQERSVAALERADIWPQGVRFHSEPVPTATGRIQWAERKRATLHEADIIFLDPDNGLGEKAEKHATISEVRSLRKPNRAVILIIFPGRVPHDEQCRQLHARLVRDAGAANVMTLRTNISVPRAKGSRFVVQRQRWFTIIDADAELSSRVYSFASRLELVPNIRVRIDSWPEGANPISPSA